MERTKVYTARAKSFYCNFVDSKLLLLIICRVICEVSSWTECFFFNQLPITEYEEEKAKGSFHFKVLGKELIYKHFTYEDVRELIEDGVIRVNNDLKDMLKKGKSNLANWKR